VVTDQWLTGGVPGAMAEVSRGAGTAGWSASEASGFPPPPPPLHAAAGPSSATLTATIVKDRLMLIASSGFEVGGDVCILRACNGLDDERMMGRPAPRSRGRAFFSIR